MMSEKKAVDEPWLQEDLSATGTLCKRKNNMIPILETKPIVNQVVNQSYSKYLNRSNDNELNNKDVVNKELDSFGKTILKQNEQVDRVRHGYSGLRLQIASEAFKFPKQRTSR